MTFLGHCEKNVLQKATNSTWKYKTSVTHLWPFAAVSITWKAHMVLCSVVYLCCKCCTEFHELMCTKETNSHRIRIPLYTLFIYLLYIYIIPVHCISWMIIATEVVSHLQNVFPVLTKPNPHILQLAFKCSHFSISVIHRLRTKRSLQQTATHFLRGRLCVMIAGKALRYKSILASVLFVQWLGCIFGALTKVWHVWFFFFTSASSASHSFRLVLISVSWGERGEKAEDSCYGLSGTQAPSENSVKLGRERGSWSVSLFSRI